MNGDIKIGKLLCDEDIITKRQLNKAYKNRWRQTPRRETVIARAFVLMISPIICNHDSDTKNTKKSNKKYNCFCCRNTTEVKDATTVEPKDEL